MGKIEREELKAGDHIYSWRTAYIYAHHGIYIGEGKIIHFTRGAGQEVGTGTVLNRAIFSSTSSSPAPGDIPCPRCGYQSRLDGVICSCIECFLSGGDLYLFEYGVSLFYFIANARGGTCTLATSDTQAQVLHRAHYLLQNGFGDYDISKNNCKDFTIYCKTGLLVVTGITDAIVSSPLGFLVPSFTGLYFAGRILSDIGIRRDLVKVPVESIVEMRKKL